MHVLLYILALLSVLGVVIPYVLSTRVEGLYSWLPTVLAL